jgi:3',5'-cyclic AMP phosphodiesterase CpdA
MKRRAFIKHSGLASIGGSTIASIGGASLWASGKVPAGREPGVSAGEGSGLRAGEAYGEIKIGICADLHQDIMHDSPARLAAFIGAMEAEKPDLILQLGDFCTPKPENSIILDIWNRWPGPKYHVLGNHDTDGGFTREQAVAFWNALAKYYSFDAKGYHFVVLDGNEHNPEYDKPHGYARFISDGQLDWLEKDLAGTKLPTLVFCHQGLDNDFGGIENATRTRTVLERANDRAGFRKVQVVFSGHHHLDYHNVINGIHYIQINSMSYFWMGEKYQTLRYSEAVDKAHPAIRDTAPYKDPIWAVVEIAPGGRFRLRGRRSDFVGPTPLQLGMPLYGAEYPVVPYISDREIRLTMQPFEAEGRL